jgi:transcriptional regulator with XRE-family HTH domain
MGSQGRVRDQFAARLRAHRERLGWSQAELAKVLTDDGVTGVYPTTIAKIEAGDRAVQVDELVGIAQAFGVSVDLLVGRYADRDELTMVAAETQSLAHANANHANDLREQLAGKLADIRYYADLAEPGAADALIEAIEAARGVLGEAQQALAALAASPLRRGTRDWSAPLRNTTEG